VSKRRTHNSMRHIKIILLVLIIFYYSTSYAVAGPINLSSVGSYPTAQLGSDYDFKLGLKSNSDIKIAKSLIQINKSKSIIGVPVLEKGSSRDGVWNIRFKIPENGPLGTFKLYIKATSGSSSFVLDRSRVKFVVKKSDEYKFSPSFKFGLPKTCGSGTMPCPSITGSNEQIKTDICKITDATPLDYEGRLSIGFPSHKKYLAGQENVKLSWIPISFSDRKYSSELYNRSKDVAAQAEGFYSLNSFGRVNFTFQVPPPEKWINLPNTVSYYEKEWTNKTVAEVTQFLLNNAGSSGADPADSITFSLPLGKYNLKYLSGYDTGVNYKLNGSTIPSERVYIISPFEGEAGDPESFAHGIGHSMYGFEDLYLSPFYSGLSEVTKPASFWDIMGGGGDFFGWSKWIAGWLKDSEVNCIANDSKSKVIYLKPFQDQAGTKLLGIPLNQSEILLAEFRTNMKNDYLIKYGLCKKGAIVPCSTYKYSGLLIYKLDTKLHHLQSPFRVAQTVDQKLLEVGESLTFEGQLFKVIASDGVGIYVEISKI
jgi:M6 family metalloprotease-like protein